MVLQVVPRQLPVADIPETELPAPMRLRLAEAEQERAAKFADVGALFDRAADLINKAKAGKR